MRPYSHLSITTKLLLIGILSSGMALLMCSAGYMYNEVASLRAHKVEDVRLLSDLLNFNLSAAVSYSLPEVTNEILESASYDSTVRIACVYDVRGELFAQYLREPECADLIPETVGEGHYFDESGNLCFFKPMIDDGNHVGTLFILSDTGEFYAKLQQYGKISVIVMCCSMLVAIMVSIVMQRNLTRPIVDLAETAQEISRGGDYSIRVSHGFRDEIGKLYDAFNRMLGKVSESETALQYAYDELEDRVAHRTTQLRQEISERRKTEERLVKAIDAAESASLAKSEFLANMSHEIRTPLNSILGFADILRRGADHGDPKVKDEYLMTIRSSGQHLLDLINDILDLSKVEAGRMEIDNERCSPHKIISEVISLTRISAIEKGLDLRYRWESGIPATVSSDESRFKQLLLNLIGNAIKFTDVGGVMVSVRLIPEDQDSKLVVTISDTGIGIASDKLETIFDPFVQVDASVTRRHGGTGLGLAITRRLSVAMGGGLELESIVGEGSTFTMTINAGSMIGVEMYDAPAADALVGQDKTVKESPVSLEALRGADVLLVEDGHTNRKVIGLMLEQAGAKVVMAENGKLGIEAVRRQSFDLILMDMQMPVMDGYSAASFLRQEGVETPIIALTAHAMKGDRAKCIAAGCIDYLPKPVDFEQLVSKLSANINSHRMLADIQPDAERQQLSSDDGVRGQDIGLEHDFSSNGVLSSGPEETIKDESQHEILNLRAIRSNLPMDNQAFVEIVAEFVDHLFLRITEMRQLADERDQEELRSAAHWLKGTAGMAGFTEFSDWAVRLSEKAKEQDWATVLQVIDQIEELARCIDVPKLA